MDATYRGVVKAAVFSCDPSNMLPNKITLHGQRLVQLAQPDLMPWDHVSIVENVPGPDTLRGEGGFGSTVTGAIGSYDRHAC